MSSKFQLKFALLAATALFLFDPDLLPGALRGVPELRAEGLTLDDQGLSATGDLLSAPSLPAGGDASGVNAALAPPALAASPVTPAAAAFATPMTAPVAAPVALNPQAAPGENPFLRQAALRPAAAPAPAPATAPGVASTPIVLPVAAPAAAAVNPFAPTGTEAGTQPGAQAGTQAGSQATGAATTVDINALRYYASKQDLKRVGAELRRLKDLYPSWQPPKDLFTPGSLVDEQPLWTIYATGNYAAVRAAIARAQSVNPKWQPSDDLLLKLQMGETRSLIASAYAQNRWAEVISTAQAMPQIMTCGEMQVQWNVAEAFARLRNYADSFDVYRYILTNCEEQDLRLATVQKASLQIPSVGFQSLLALGRITADGHPEFENIGFDGIRRQIGAYIEHGDFSETPSSEEIARFVDFVQRNASVADANLIGWYFYSQKEWQSANAWFLQAARFKRDPKSIEGVVLTLRQMDKTEEALKIARHYVKLSPDVARQFIEIVASDLTAEKPALALKDTDDALFQSLVMEQKSALGAQALGWKALAANDRVEAKDWFDSSVEWAPTEGGVVGLAVVAARTKNNGALSALKAKYGKTYVALQDFKVYKIRTKPAAAARPVRKVETSKPKTLADYFKSST